MTDPAVQADMDSVDHHWLSHLKTAWMLYKAADTLIGTLSAAKSWNKSSLRMGGPAQMLLLFNAVVCVLVTVFKFTSKHVGPLFVLQALSHYGFFLAFVVLVTYNENPAVRDAGAKVVKKLTPLHALYGFVIVYGFFKQSKCSDSNPYPLCFVLGDVLFFATYVACARFSKKDLENCYPKEISEKEAAEKSNATL